MDRQKGGLFFLHSGQKRDTGAGKCAIIPDFRVGDNVLTRVAEEDGGRKIVVATKEERGAWRMRVRVRVSWTYEELGDV